MNLPARLALVAWAALVLVIAPLASVSAQTSAPQISTVQDGVAPLPAVQNSSTRTSSVSPTTTAVNPRALAGGAALIVTGLLLLLYFYRRRVYILYWIAGWILTALSMFLAAPAYQRPAVANVAFGVSQFIAIVSALMFVVSADAYRSKPRLRREYVIALLPVLIWFTLSPLPLGIVAVYAPGHLLIAGALAAAAVANLALLRREWLLGATVVGLMLLLLAALNGWLALSAPGPDAAVAGGAVFITLALYLVTALGMQLMMFEDMTYELRVTNRRLESAQEDLRTMVTTDALTGCRNRRYFDEVIGREVQRHRRYNIPLSLIFIDVDRFKAVNDTLGHEAGDRVLQLVAFFLIRNLREADYVFRWGGDEFLILISCTESEAARKAAVLQAAFASSEDAASLPAGVGLSVGCAQVSDTSDDIHQLVKLADARMYENKRAVAHR